MVEVLRLNQPYTFKVKQESIKSILIHAQPKSSSGDPVSVGDLTHVTIDLTLRNDLNPNLSTQIFSGNLKDLLESMYCQTTYNQIIYRAHDQAGHFITLRFDDYPIETTANTYLEIKTNFSQNAFPSAVLANSSVTLETIPSEVPNYNNIIPVIDTYYIGNNSNRFDENIGSDVVGLVSVIEHGKSLLQTQKAKISSMELTAFGGYNKSVSEAVLLAENYQIIGATRTGAYPTNYVLYNNTNAPLDDSRLKISFTDNTDSTQKILVIRLVQPFA